MQVQGLLCDAINPLGGGLITQELIFSPHSLFQLGAYKWHSGLPAQMQSARESWSQVSLSISV